LPVKFILPLIDQIGLENEQTTFHCAISKNKMKKTGKIAVVKWFKGEREIRESSKYLVTNLETTHKLTIKNLDFLDIAEYSAVVLNEKTSAKLDVNGNYFS
jgi:hypothetical protein